MVSGTFGVFRRMQCLRGSLDTTRAVDTLVSMLKTQVSKWGNSAAVRIPESVVRETGLVPGKSVSITYNRNAIMIAEVKDVPLSLSQLIKRITKENVHAYAWKGVAPLGGEIW